MIARSPYTLVCPRCRSAKLAALRLQLANTACDDGGQFCSTVPAWRIFGKTYRCGRLVCFPSPQTLFATGKPPSARLFFTKEEKRKSYNAVGAGSGWARKGLFVAEGFSADRAALAPSP